MSKDELLALADRIEAADGPSRELDLAIKSAVYGGVVLRSPFNGELCLYRPETTDPRVGRTLERPRSVPHQAWITDRYSSSLDAAMTLVPEGYDWIIGHTNGGLTIYAEVGGTGGDYTSWAPTPALALCSAAIRAKAEETRDGD